MRRDEGFPIADISTAMLDDPKIKTLARTLRDEATMSKAVVLYLAAVLASWGAGDRATAEDAAPLWLTPDADLLTKLEVVGLLTPDHRIPERTWKAWHGPAYDRRQSYKERGQLGGLRAHGARTREEAEAIQQSPAIAQLQPPYTPTVLPTVLPTDRQANRPEAAGSKTILTGADAERAAEKDASDAFIRATGILPAPARVSHPEKADAILDKLRLQFTPKESATP